MFVIVRNVPTDRLNRDKQPPTLMQKFSTDDYAVLCDSQRSKRINPTAACERRAPRRDTR